MKLTVFFSLFFSFTALSNGFSQVTLSARNSHLGSVLQNLRKQTGYAFLVDSDALKTANSVTVELKNKSIEESLSMIFKSQPLDYRIEGKTIRIKPRQSKADVPAQPSQKDIDIKGKVVNESGKALRGATVSIVVQHTKADEKTGEFAVVMVGRKTAAITDADGAFQLKDVDTHSIVTVSYLGYEPQSFEVKADLGTIKLKPDDSAIQEVYVSTGYQTLSKERSAGSASKPDMATIADRSSSMNVLQRMDGLIPGLAINNAPIGQEEDRTPFLIRGLNTLNSDKNPLVVVDGMPMDMANINSINPQDVADITVLKDATASSIWGARASNGVIVITTKRGSEGRTKVSYDGFVNIQGKPQYDYFPVLNSAQYIQASRETFDPISFPYATASIYQPSSVAVGIAPDRQILYDIDRGVLSSQEGDRKLDSLARLDNLGQIGSLWYRPAVLTNHNLSVSGGGPKHNFYNSLSFTNAQDYTPGNTDQTFKLNTRQDFVLNKSLSAYLIADLNYQTTGADNSKSVDNRFIPYQLFRDVGGQNLAMPYLGYLSEAQRGHYESLTELDLNYNPLDDVKSGFHKRNNFSGRFHAGLNAKLYKGLRFEGFYGYIRGNRRSQRYMDHTGYQQRINTANFSEQESDGTIRRHLPNSGGEYLIDHAQQENWVVRNQLAYDYQSESGRHQLTALLGHEAQQLRTINNHSLVYGYDIDLQTSAKIDYHSLALTGPANPILPRDDRGSLLEQEYFEEFESVPRTRFLSYYANAAYTLDRKYTLNASWRNDQSNLFGVSRSAQNKPVWSVGVKWDINREAWMAPLQETISALALRATYGITGIAPKPGFASSKDIFKPYYTVSAPGGQAIVISTLSNPYLTWESTQNYNIGVDFAFLKNRLSGALDLYEKRTSNLLGLLPVNPLAGVEYINGNVGNLSNKGIELSLSSKNIIQQDFTWTSILTMAYNKNKITELGALVTPITTGRQVLEQEYIANHPAFGLFAYNYAGLDHLGDPQIKKADGSITKLEFDNKPEDMLYMGVYQAPWTGGLSNMFQYKSWSLNLNMVYHLGHVFFKDINRTYSGNGLIANQSLQAGNYHADFAQRWKEAGDELNTDIPSFVANSGISLSRRYIDYYIYGNQNIADASFVKLRDITLSYALPTEWLKRIKAEGLSFRFQVSNLMLWKANKDGIDPEFHDARYRYSSAMPINQGTFTIGAHLTL
ncbi:SusC/RagA family TonB-linked outer membrane protein [Sphingobacterium tabacisoli]|uniref:SusC/RagA family TonB-linked outer membrane protein n=1 Tax=Sphingobacterium tabacisoli TaxID=2044855 RepID=A0ABW5L7L3_9SPHI|nr:SusC/RagA family TonB-linked outer membrane protein [Sphingobacterium tabacisoli]